VAAFGQGNVTITNNGTIAGATDAIDATTASGVVVLDNTGYLAGNVLAANATFTNEVSAIWSLNGLSTFTGTSTLSNAGVIDSNGTSVISGLSGTVNTGLIEVLSGSLLLNGPVSGDGTAVVYGATLEFGGASDANVQFATSTTAISGLLVLDDVAHFAGTVTGFNFGDTIDLVGISPASVTITNAGSLSVNYGSGSFGLLGNYNPAGFSIVGDGHGGTDIIWNHHAPLISTSSVTTVSNPDGTTTVQGLQISDTEASAVTDTFSVTTSTDMATSSVAPSTSSGLLAAANSTLSAGITYNPGNPQPLADKVAVTVTDKFGANDTVNFVFDQAGSGPLQGTSGKDVIFSTNGSDLLTGGGGQDQFVFAPTSSGPSVQHTITDFISGVDKLDVRQFSGLTSTTLPTEAQQGADVLVTLDSHDTLLLKNVQVSSLHGGSDFILHA
jgi:large repetitive protein